MSKVQLVASLMAEISAAVAAKAVTPVLKIANHAGKDTWTVTSGGVIVTNAGYDFTSAEVLLIQSFNGHVHNEVSRIVSVNPPLPGTTMADLKAHPNYLLSFQ